MKYFADASNNGPVEAFYASFMPDVQRAHKLENLIQTTDWAKSFQGFKISPHKKCMQNIAEVSKNVEES